MIQSAEKFHFLKKLVSRLNTMCLRKTYSNIHTGIHLSHTFLPNKMLNSNLSWETSYPDWGYSWFFLVLPGKSWNIISIRPWPLSSKSFLTHDSSIIIPSGIIQSQYWKSIIKQPKERKQKTYFLSGIVWNKRIYWHCFYRMAQEGLDLNRTHHHLVYADGINYEVKTYTLKKTCNFYEMWAWKLV